MEIQINNIQREFILRGIANIECLYDFDEGDEEFELSYGISKTELKEQVKELKEVQN